MLVCAHIPFVFSWLLYQKFVACKEDNADSLQLIYSYEFKRCQANNVSFKEWNILLFQFSSRSKMKTRFFTKLGYANSKHPVIWKRKDFVLCGIQIEDSWNVEKEELFKT